MAIRRIEKFVTDDGTEHDTKAEAEAHALLMCSRRTLTAHLERMAVYGKIDAGDILTALTDDRHEEFAQALADFHKYANPK